MTFRRIAAGDVIAVPADVYGVTMRPAPSDGVVIEHGERSLYLSATDIETLRRLVKERMP